MTEIKNTTSKTTSASAKTTNSIAVQLQKFTPLQYSASLAEISEAIWKIEGIRVVFCAAPARRVPGMGYDYVNKLKSGCVGDLHVRLEAVLKASGDTIEWVIVDGTGRAKFPKTWKLDKIRVSYNAAVSTTVA